jgi:predicted glycoside hydrolase/deacetylase ChbG (UPF0249 family)
MSTVGGSGRAAARWLWGTISGGLAMGETIAGTDARARGDGATGAPAVRQWPTRFHADDLGLSDAVNEVTERLLHRRLLVGVSLVANGPATVAAARLVRERPVVDVYLHLNLTEGRPVATSVGAGAGLTDRGGELLGPRRLIWALVRGRVDAGAVEEELGAQLDVLEALGVPVAGIDSHHHVHALSPVSDVVDRVAAARGITRRRSYHLVRTHTRTGRRRKLLLASLARASSRAVTGRIELPTSWRGGDAGRFAMASWERLDRVADPGVTTVVVHPGGSCDKLPPLPLTLLSGSPGGGWTTGCT